MAAAKNTDPRRGRRGYCSTRTNAPWKRSTFRTRPFPMSTNNPYTRIKRLFRVVVDRSSYNTNNYYKDQSKRGLQAEFRRLRHRLHCMLFYALAASVSFSPISYARTCLSNHHKYRNQTAPRPICTIPRCSTSTTTGAYARSSQCQYASARPD